MVARSLWLEGAVRSTSRDITYSSTNMFQASLREVFESLKTSFHSAYEGSGIILTLTQGCDLASGQWPRGTGPPRNIIDYVFISTSNYLSVHKYKGFRLPVTQKSRRRRFPFTLQRGTLLAQYCAAHGWEMEVTRWIKSLSVFVHCHKGHGL